MRLVSVDAPPELPPPGCGASIRPTGRSTITARPGVARDDYRVQLYFQARGVRRARRPVGRGAPADSFSSSEAVAPRPHGKSDNKIETEHGQQQRHPCDPVPSPRPGFQLGVDRRLPAPRRPLCPARPPPMTSTPAARARSADGPACSVRARSSRRRTRCLRTRTGPLTLVVSSDSDRTAVAPPSRYRWQRALARWNRGRMSPRWSNDHRDRASAHASGCGRVTV